ncbi:hypothetical protein [Nostoc linckia]|uniref:hypothetical protein n=1 Tax=Nostoc linckia TaxID=92942 RepID=UPI0015D4C51E|nr:hypothetical protein [Nostoc linckia]
MGRWGDGEMGRWERQGRKIATLSPLSLLSPLSPFPCSMPHAPCSMPNAPCPIRQDDY